MSRLHGSTSTYLAQHADNPVDWWPWGDEAFAEARRRDVPVLLSVGYAACHWCHVMARESFYDPATAELLNRDFVSIKVDREERPDVDAVYMTATQALTGQGGWPMTVFLTPDAQPFYARDVLPTGADRRDAVVPPAAHGARRGVARRPRPRADLRGAHRLVARGDVRAVGSAAARRGRSRPGRRGAGGPVRPGARRLPRRTEIPADDGGGVPAAARRADGIGGSPRRSASTLERMARGGIYDQLGGGFARYSVDAVWHVPHFEKMLDDNASCSRCTRTTRGSPAPPSRPASPRRSPSSCCATSACPRVRSPWRSTPTPPASRGSRTCGRARTWAACSGLWTASGQRPCSRCPAP